MGSGRLNPNSDAWGGSWGSASAWGGSWGWSFGPLHEVEEQPQQYYGNGQRRPGLPPDPLLSDADYEALVREKWDAIERAQSKEKPISFTSAESYVKESPKPLHDDHFAGAGNMIAAPSIIATHWPLPADEVAAAAILKAKQAREDEDLLLVLAELL